MKTFLKNLFRIAGKTALAGCLTVGVWRFLTPYFRIDHNDTGDLFRTLPEDSLDVVVVGSSHAQYAFDPGVLYAETGLYSYVMGSMCQPPETSYYMMEEILKTQSPEVIIMDVFTFLPQSQVCYGEGMYYTAIDMMTGETRVQAALNMPDSEAEKRLPYAYDLIMNHNNWRVMDFSDPDSILDNAELNQGPVTTFGFVRQEPTDIRTGSYDTYAVSRQVELSQEEKDLLDRMITLCEENDVHLLFIKTPYKISQEDTDKLAALWAYLEEKGQDYVDYANHPEAIGWHLLMDGDIWHNNSWGAEKVTRGLGEYILENGLVQNHQDNEELEQQYAQASLTSAYSLIVPYNLDVQRLLHIAAAYQNTAVAVRYTAREGTMLTEEDQEALASIGLSKDFLQDYDTDYYAFVVNGQPVQESSEPFQITYNGSVLEFTEDGILIDGAYSSSHTDNMELIFMTDTASHTDPIGIDTMLRLWPSACWEWACNGHAPSVTGDPY